LPLATLVSCGRLASALRRGVSSAGSFREASQSLRMRPRNHFSSWRSRFGGSPFPGVIGKLQRADRGPGVPVAHKSIRASLGSEGSEAPYTSVTLTVGTGTEKSGHASIIGCRAGCMTTTSIHGLTSVNTKNALSSGGTSDDKPIGYMGSSVIRYRNHIRALNCACPILRS
jgi:hypothetical protein